MQLTIVLHDAPQVSHAENPNMNKLHDILETKQGLYRKEIAPTNQDASEVQTYATGPGSLRGDLSGQLAMELYAINSAQSVASNELTKTNGYLFFASDRRSYLQKGDSEAEKIAVTLKMVEEWREMDDVLRQIFESDAEKIIAKHAKLETKDVEQKGYLLYAKDQSTWMRQSGLFLTKQEEENVIKGRWNEMTTEEKDAIIAKQGQEVVAKTNPRNRSEDDRKQKALALFSQKQHDAGRTNDQMITAEWDDMAPREKQAWLLAANSVDDKKKLSLAALGRTKRLADEAKELEFEFKRFSQERSDMLSSNTRLSDDDIARQVEREWAKAGVERDAYLLFMIRRRNRAKHDELNLTREKMFNQFNTEWHALDDREKEELRELVRKRPGKPVHHFMRGLEVPVRRSFVLSVRRPLSPYLYFCSERRPELKKEDPTMPFADLTQQIVAEWKSLTIPERKRWIDLSDADKARYERELLASSEQSRKQ